MKNEIYEGQSIRYLHLYKGRNGVELIVSTGPELFQGIINSVNFETRKEAKDYIRILKTQDNINGYIAHNF